MKEMGGCKPVNKQKHETKQIKTAKRVGSMRFTKCGTFRGFKYD